MEIDEKKKPGFDKRISPELLREMRNRFLLMRKGMSYEEMSLEVAKDYPQFKPKTIEDYASLCSQVCEEVFQLMETGKISITVLLEFKCGWDETTQKYIAKECVENGLSLSMLRQMKRLKRNHSTMGYTEAIARVKGEIPPEQPRKENRKSLDQVLTQLADMGNRWRAMSSMAIELIQQEEAAAGVHEMIFEKMFVYRQVVSDQYDFINSKIQRSINAIRKQLKGASENKLIVGNEVTKEGLIDEARKMKDAGESKEGVIDAEFNTNQGNSEAPTSDAPKK